MERMAASVPRHTLTMRRRQSAPKTGGDLGQHAALPAQRRADPRAREQRRSLWPVAGRAPAHRPGRPGRRRGVALVFGAAAVASLIAWVVITIDPSDSSPFLRTHAKLLPVSRAHNHDSTLSGPRDTPIPTASARSRPLTRRGCWSSVDHVPPDITR